MEFFFSKLSLARWTGDPTAAYVDQSCTADVVLWPRAIDLSRSLGQDRRFGM